jgi:hypothetical protein
MFVGIVFAFCVAVVNWLCDKAFGLRFLSRFAQQVTFVMVPPLFLIFLVLGTIFIGLATPTEGGAMGASGALALALIKRRLSWDLTRQAAEVTAKLSSFVVFILIGARVFSLTFYGVDGHRWVEELLVSLPGGVVGFLVFVNVFVFFLAFFLDFFEIAFIVLPLLVPAAEKLGVDLVWLGVMLGVNMQTSFMHPPFGFALFYLRSVAPRTPYKDRVTGAMTEPVTTGQIYWGAIPFVFIQCLMVATVIAFPLTVMHYKASIGPPIDPNKIEIAPLPFGPPGVPFAPTLPPELSKPDAPPAAPAPAEPPKAPGAAPVPAVSPDAPKATEASGAPAPPQNASKAPEAPAAPPVPSPEAPNKAGTPPAPTVPPAEPGK